MGRPLSSDTQIATSEYFSDGTREITSDRFANGFLEENRVQDMSLRLDNFCFESDRFFYELNVSAFNTYGRNNVWYRKFDLSDGAVVVTDVTTLPFTPSIGFRMGIK